MTERGIQSPLRLPPLLVSFILLAGCASAGDAPAYGLHGDAATSPAPLHAAAARSVDAIHHPPPERGDSRAQPAMIDDLSAEENRLADALHTLSAERRHLARLNRILRSLAPEPSAADRRECVAAAERYLTSRSQPPAGEFGVLLNRLAEAPSADMLADLEAEHADLEARIREHRNERRSLVRLVVALQTLHEHPTADHRRKADRADVLYRRANTD